MPLPVPEDIFVVRQALYIPLFHVSAAAVILNLLSLFVHYRKKSFIIVTPFWSLDARAVWTDAILLVISSHAYHS